MNPIGHFRTITKHRHMVIRHCFKAGIPLRGLLHDLSKYSPTEFIPGARFYTGTKSPNEGERDAYGYSRAWLHHKGRNRHHFEYWTDVSTAEDHWKIVGVTMPVNYLAEMVMDRISASQVYNGKNYNDQMPLEYYEKNKDKLWFVHEQTKRELSYILRILAEDGEDAMYEYVRYVYLGKR